MRLRQYVTPKKGELVVLVDDILRAGSRMAQLKELMEGFGATIVAAAVVIYQPTPRTRDLGKMPFYHLARLEASYYGDGASCELCRNGLPAEKVWS
jgi:adenine/guanine phosphoribosyltransferase-like PRPP-binding protein